MISSAQILSFLLNANILYITSKTFGSMRCIISWHSFLMIRIAFVENNFCFLNNSPYENKVQFKSPFLQRFLPFIEYLQLASKGIKVKISTIKHPKDQTSLPEEFYHINFWSNDPVSNPETIYGAKYYGEHIHLMMLSSYGYGSSWRAGSVMATNLTLSKLVNYYFKDAPLQSMILISFYFNLQMLFKVILLMIILFL